MSQRGLASSSYYARNQGKIKAGIGENTEKNPIPTKMPESADLSG
jgi:hypothetical protein